MAMLLISFGVLDVVAGLYIFNGTMRSDSAKSYARIGAVAFTLLMLSSAVLLISAGLKFAFM